MPGFVDLSFLQPLGFATLNPGSGLVEIPFLDRMGFVFIICVLVMIIISLQSPQPKDSLQVDFSMFKTSRSFAVGAMIILVILATLYIKFW